MIRLNLLPKEERGKSDRKINWSRMSVVLGLSGVVLLVFAGVFNMTLIARLQERLVEVGPQMMQLRSIESELHTARSLNAARRIDLTSARSFLVRPGNEGVVELLQSIAQVTPAEIWLRQLQMNTGNSVTVNGYATQAADISLYLSDLQNIERVEGIQITALSRVGEGPGALRIFGLQITVSENVNEGGT